MSNGKKVTSLPAGQAGNENKNPRITHYALRITCYALLAFLSHHSIADTPKIYGVEYEPHKYYDNFYIKTNGTQKPKIIRLSDRLIIDFKGAQTDKPQKIPISKSKRVEAVRIGQFEPTVARVVFDLKKNISFDTATLYGKGKVLVEISDANEKAPTAKESVEAVALVDKEKNTHKDKAKKKSKGRKLPLLGKIIVVDPGHGGKDPGAMGPGGIPEKEFTLKTALYLADYLREKGAKVFLTRKTDVKKKLKDIAEFTNQIGADVYIGVHYNSIDNPRISGSETHYYTNQSFKLAEAVHNKLLRGIRRPDRGIKKTMLYTVHHALMPAIIVEPIYMTHFQDGLLLRSKSFKKEVARDIASGVVDYFHER